MTAPTSARTLILMRHAEAEHGHGHGHGKPDHDRELAPRGRGDARAVGVWISDPMHAGRLDLVLCSTSQRTRQTLDGVLAGGTCATDTRFEQGIYDASAVALIDLLRAVPDWVNSVLMIGHAPGIPVLAAALAGEGKGLSDVIDRLSLGFPTCALAVLQFEGRWARLAPESAYLRDFVVPGA
jgi:phosphohistidine phosphatase